MADMENVIKEFEHLLNAAKGNYQDFVDLTVDGGEEILALLKEREAVKPCIAVDTWICPKCGHTLESQYLIDDKENPQVLVHEQYNFCPNCGQEVKWE